MWRILQYPYLFELICLVWYNEHGISILKKKVVSWFRILLQNDVGIDFFLGFDRVMQYPSKFQNICYGTQKFYGIPEEG
jgi:hypothetical protein